MVSNGSTSAAEASTTLVAPSGEISTITSAVSASGTSRASPSRSPPTVPRADVIDVTKLSGDTIKFGATVRLIDEDTDKKQVYQIVGEPEADAKRGKISVASPLARALIGKTKGTSVEVVTPGGARAYEVKKVEWR